MKYNNDIGKRSENEVGQQGGLAVDANCLLQNCFVNGADRASVVSTDREHWWLFHHSDTYFCEPVNLIILLL